MLPPELSEELCSLRSNTDRLCLTVEVPLDDGLGRRAALLPLRDPKPRAPDLLARAGDSARGRAGQSRTWTDALRRRAARDHAARPPLRARSAPNRAGKHVRLRRRGGVERAWREAEPHAHMLVEADDPANGWSRSCSLAGGAKRSTAMHELPDAVGAAHARPPGRPRRADAARPRVLSPVGRRGHRRSGQRGRDRVRQDQRPRAGRIPAARSPGAEASTLRPAQPRPHGARQLRVLPFHLADPALPRPGRPPRASARAPFREPRPRICQVASTPWSVSHPGPSTARTRSSRGCSRNTSSSSAGVRPRRRDTGAIRRHLRA